MNFNLDIKTLAFLATLTASACGLYYTMQGRIESTESRVESVEKDLSALKKKVNKLGKKKKK
jgi:cell division protein FtsL